jgi:hypothetical protein
VVRHRVERGERVRAVADRGGERVIEHGGGRLAERGRQATIERGRGAMEHGGGRFGSERRERPQVSDDDWRRRRLRS